MEDKMPVVCAWCGKVIKKGRGDTMGKVSHRCCPECRDKILEEVQEGEHETN